MLALLLGRAPGSEVLDRIAGIAGDSSALGAAHAALAEAARAADAEEVASEYFALFVGVGRGELLPYASYYLTGFLHERPLARVREDLRALGIEREAAMSEPEDHLALLCESMAGLVSARFAAPEDSDRRFFERHLRPWAGRFFADLEAAQAARFYRAVALVGRRFMEIEAEAFTLPA
jgi:TorA maturation chaperone TorD